MVLEESYKSPLAWWNVESCHRRPCCQHLTHKLFHIMCQGWVLQWCRPRYQSKTARASSVCLHALLYSFIYHTRHNSWEYCNLIQRQIVRDGHRGSFSSNLYKDSKNLRFCNFKAVFYFVSSKRMQRKVHICNAWSVDSSKCTTKILNAVQGDIHKTLTQKSTYISHIL